MYTVSVQTRTVKILGSTKSHKPAKHVLQPQNDRKLSESEFALALYGSTLQSPV
jgi:hypothetical protein